MVNPRRFIWPALGLALAVALLAIWSPSGDPPNYPQTLPDGTVLTLVQVDYGKTNTLWEGSRFEKKFHRFIPPKGINLLGIHINRPIAVHTVTNSNDVLVFWLKHSSNGWLPSFPSQKVGIAFDENGNELEIYGGQNVLDDRSSTNQYSAWEIPAFPRNGKTVGLRIMDNGLPSDRRPIAEFVARNPTPGPHREWNPPPLPLTNRVGDVDFVLANLDVGPPGPPAGFGNRVFQTQGDSRLHARATFMVLENGNVSPDWTVELPPDQVTDVCGNRTSPYQPRLSEAARDTETTVDWSFPLGSNAPWIIPAQFHRFNDFRQKSVIEVRDLPVPGPAGHPTVWKTNVFGSTFAVTVYADALIVSFPGTPRELFLGTVSLSTNQGGALILSKEWLRNEHSLTLDVPKNSRTVCVACEVFRKTIVEFIARPRWVTGTNRLSELRNGTP